MTQNLHPYDPLSADTLFHFTKTYDSLHSILQEGFKPHYCLEDFSTFESLATIGEFALPLVSFCDIPLATIRNHIETYGPFGIGLSKQWGRGYGISPVLYVFPEATVGKSLNQILELLFKQAAENEDRLLQRTASLTMGQAKAYEGRLWRDGNYTDKSIRFYDEKEWRYVPDVLKVSLPNVLRKQVFLDTDVCAEYNRELAVHFKLSFDASHVKYLIVEHETDIKRIIGDLRLMPTKFVGDDLDTLLTRIVSVDQILNDY